jgi:hypothetical protein
VPSVSLVNKKEDVYLFGQSWRCVPSPGGLDPQPCNLYGVSHAWLKCGLKQFSLSSISLARTITTHCLPHQVSLDSSTGRLHMWASEMVNHCGINTWKVNSFIVHATGAHMHAIYCSMHTAHECALLRSSVQEHAPFRGNLGRTCTYRRVLANARRGSEVPRDVREHHSRMSTLDLSGGGDRITGKFARTASSNVPLLHHPCTHARSAFATDGVFAFQRVNDSKAHSMFPVFSHEPTVVRGPSGEWVR